MRGLHKSKRVSWASDLDLCQVRLFLSEESPSQVGLNKQDHLQAKTSIPLHPSEAGSDDILPPGFEATHPSSQLQIKLSEIPVVRWINPPKIVLNLTWQVVAGEESREVEDQSQREMRVLEAIYPRSTSIPPNPSVSVDVEDSHCIDCETALIPITPIEDEDVAADALSDSMAPCDVSLSSQPLPLPPGIPERQDSTMSMQLPNGVESDVAAASLALTNILKSSEHGNLLDHELLSNILNNPEVIEKLVRDFGATSNSQSVHNAGSSLVASSHQRISVNHGETSMPYPPLTGGSVSTQWLPRPAVTTVTISSPVEVSSAKDVNYYKSLVQQHGGEKRETLPYSSNRQMQQWPVANPDAAPSSRSRESKPKIMKPCIFFNSSRGCRNGANCAYQHDAAAFPPRGSTVPGTQGSKRMKMDSEISS